MEFLARHELARALKEHPQDLQRLFLQRDLRVSGPQLSGASIQLEVAETDRASQVGAQLHRGTRIVSRFYHGSSLDEPVSEAFSATTFCPSAQVIHFSSRYHPRFIDPRARPREGGTKNAKWGRDFHDQGVVTCPTHTVQHDIWESRSTG